MRHKNKERVLCEKFTRAFPITSDITRIQRLIRKERIRKVKNVYVNTQSDKKKRKDEQKSKEESMYASNSKTRS